jgi:NitT/TauT family transport system ATP-binding protein
LGSISLEVARGELIAILGPNGSGKTTLLKVLAGLLDVDGGTVSINGSPPAQSRVGLMLQSYGVSLFPWLKNVDNLAFVLDKRFADRHERRQYVEQFTRKMGLADLPLDRYPYQCSGGQQQLLALARELIYEPDVLLLDEPFAALDYERRLVQHKHLLEIWTKSAGTIVLVSHDIDDALFLADRVVLLSRGPSVIAETFEVALPRPRRSELLLDSAYIDLRRTVHRRFMELLAE